MRARALARETMESVKKSGHRGLGLAQSGVMNDRTSLQAIDSASGHVPCEPDGDPPLRASQFTDYFESSSRRLGQAARR